MEVKPSLAELIKHKEIEFYSYGRKLDSNLSQYGKYNEKVISHLLKTAGNKIVMKGNGLERHLNEMENLYPLAEFVVHMQDSGSRKYPDLAIHVDVDIEKLNQYYPKPKEEELVNGLGQVVGDASSWVPEMPYFEKVWNFALDQAVGGMVCYPGYEHPRNDLSFRIRVAEFAEHYMIGTKQQIQRYKKYALDALQNLTGLADQLKADPELIFHDDDYKLQGIQLNAKQAIIIAENISYIMEAKHWWKVIFS
ncbi:MAG: hypothetical protein Q8R47_02985 [Nanoarchaeota archaeon]|nr:hypothetical protein [Nanoarchaeota archaeon]